MRARSLGLLLGATIAASACGFVPDDCAPVDPGGQCFPPDRVLFLAHAKESARAWPQLAGLAIQANEVIEGVDAVAGEPTWIVPLRSGEVIVGASRFLPFRDQVRLAEVVLYQPPRRTFPVPDVMEELRLVAAPCGDPLPDTCLFRNHGWRMEPPP